MTSQAATAIQMIQAAAAARWYRDYLAGFTDETWGGFNPWGDGLQECDGYSETKTDALPFAYQSDRVAFDDGSLLVFDEQGQCVVTAADGEQLVLDAE